MKKRFRWRLVELMFREVDLLIIVPPNINFTSLQRNLLAIFHFPVFVGLSRVRKRLVLNLPPCHVTAVQQQAADGQLTARGKGLVCDKNEA